MSPIWKLLVDGYALGEGSRDRGIGMYLSTVLKGLAVAPDLEVTVLASDSAPLPQRAQRRTIRRRMPPRLAAREHELLLRRDVRRSRPDVFWSPAQSVPRDPRSPLVQTLHDLTPLVYRHPYLARDARRWSRQGPRLRKAAAVIVPSSSTARQAVEHLGLEEGRIQVIPHAAGPTFSPEGPRHHVELPYVLLVAAWGPHKGFEDAARAMQEVARRGLPHRLLIAGPQDRWMLEQAMRALAASGGDPDRIELLGFVQDLPALYRGAELLIMPSRAEGFGLPVLEAMASGTPVVTYDNTSLAEVGGSAAVLVPDGAVGQLGRAVADLLEDGQELARRSRLGLAHVSRYSWETSVEAHASLFRSVARGDVPISRPARHQ